MRRSSAAAPVPGDAPAVERGVGFFETILVVGRAAARWEQHVARLLGTLAELDLPRPDARELRAAATAALADRDGADEVALRLTWLAIGGDLDARESWRLDVAVRPIPPLTRRRRHGCHARSLPSSLLRDSPVFKSTSYLSAALGLRLAARAGADEGLFRAADGSYVEGTSTALLAWDGGRLVRSCHPALPSVTSNAFLGDEAVRRAPLSGELLRRGAIVLSSLTLAAPLCSLDGEPCALDPAMLARIRSFNDEVRAASQASLTPLL